MNVLHDFSEYSGLIFCGDIHGKIDRLVDYIDDLEIKDSVILCVGDCGFGYLNKRYIQRLLFPYVKKSAERSHNVFVFMRGNHDNPIYYRDPFVYVPDMAKYQHEIVLVDDYDILRSPHGDVLCIGGAFSIDRPFRKLVPYGEDQTDGMVYFEGEEVLPINRERELFIRNFHDSINMVATHTAPRFCHPFNWDANVYGYIAEHPDVEKASMEERGLMNEIYRTIKHDIGCPLKYWVYGHFHTHIREEFEGTDFILLDRDRPGRKKGETKFDLFEVR